MDSYFLIRYTHTAPRPEYIQLQPTQQRLNPQAYDAQPSNASDQASLQQQMSRSYTSNTSYQQHQYQATSPGRR